METREHIDITFDFETVSTMPDAAPMQLAAVVWRRDAVDGERLFTGDQFCEGIDLRSCVMDGFDFDRETVKFWESQDELVKMSVTDCECLPVETVYRDFVTWTGDMKRKYNAQTVCLWCQGMDFDFPILKTAARKYGVGLPVHQHWFRDCRTVVLEAAMAIAGRGTLAYQLADGTALTAGDIMEKPSLAYRMIQPMPDKIAAGRSKHDALYDCCRSSWNVWWCMKVVTEMLRQ